METQKNKFSAIGRAKRPIFIPNPNAPGVSEELITFDWHMGMSAAVKKRSITSLHEQAKKKGFKNILEASSKSEQPLGLPLSAFFLKDEDGVPVENLFQSSKVFENGGAFLDLRHVSPRAAKKDLRLKESGAMLKFLFNGKEFPLEPKSLFYDWLYSKILYGNNNIELKNQLINEVFDAFSDIEFNPKKSFSCQARTLALFISLHSTNCLREFIEDPFGTADKYQLYRGVSYGEHRKQKKYNSHNSMTEEPSLFPSESIKKKEEASNTNIANTAIIFTQPVISQNIHEITLGVASIEDSRNFYRNIFGWREIENSNDGVVRFQVNDILVLVLRPRKSSNGNIPYPFSLSHSVATREEVDRLFSWFASKNIKISKSPCKDKDKDKYGGYISDPDGFLWNFFAA